MPTTLREKGYRFFFFSNESLEPPHTHVQKGEHYAKLWLRPVRLAKNVGFRRNEISEIGRIVTEKRGWLLKAWMAALPNRFRPLASGVAFTNGRMIVKLADGRELSVPLECFPRLRRATPRERRKWELIGRGLGMHWPLIDEDISVEDLLAPRPRARRRAAAR